MKLFDRGPSGENNFENQEKRAVVIFVFTPDESEVLVKTTKKTNETAVFSGNSPFAETDDPEEVAGIELNHSANLSRPLQKVAQDGDIHIFKTHVDKSEVDLNAGTSKNMRWLPVDAAENTVMRHDQQKYIPLILNKE